MLTTDLKIAYEKICMSYNEEVSSVLSVWMELGNQVALDMKACILALVVDADFLNERGRSTPRKIIRGRQRGLPELAKLSTSPPWNELLIASPTGEVWLNEALTKGDVAVLCQIHTQYAGGCLSQPYPKESSENDHDQTPPPPRDEAFAISTKTGLQRRELPNTPAKRMLHSCFVWRTPEKIARNRWVVYKGPVTVVYDSSTDTYAQMDSDGNVGSFDPLLNLVARLDKEIDSSVFPKAHQST